MWKGMGVKMKTDTIAAIATAMSNSGIGVVRLSGDESLSIIDKIFAVYTEYQKVLAQSNALDFDDLLFLTYKLFLMRSDIRSRLQQRVLC